MSEPEIDFEIVEVDDEHEAVDVEFGAPDYVEDAPLGAGTQEIEVA